MWELVREESAGKIGMGALGGDLAFLEKIGCAYTMIGFPRSAKAETEDEVYAQFRKIIDSTSMATVLYGSPVESLRRFHPSGIPLKVFDRLADHPNVVGIKLTHPMSVATAFEICERLSNRLIMGPCNFDHIPVLAKNYKNVQWSGLWITDALQSPERPYAVEMMDLVIKGRMAEAMKVYWQMQPLIQGIYDLQAPLLLHESHPWGHMKYLQWVTGGNGGLLPLKPAPVFTGARRTGPRAHQEHLQEGRHYSGGPARGRVRGRQSGLRQGRAGVPAFQPAALRIEEATLMSTRRWILVLPFPYTASTDPNHRLRL